MKRTSIALGLFLLLMQLSAIASNRVALVIGNSQYADNLGSLMNPVNDAMDISKKLKGFGFEVTTLKNATQHKMDDAISLFGQRISKDGVIGLFYFAGHGVQVKGENYLIPIGSGITSEADVKYKAVNAGQILSQMDQANNGFNLVILDACRNNPFGRSFRSVSRGLARMDAPSGSLIFYATKPGQVAQDGAGRNGVFTEQLLKSMNDNLKIEDIFKDVAVKVSNKTNKEQEPWMEGVLYGNFYFNPSLNLDISRQNRVVNESAEDSFIDFMDKNDPNQLAAYLDVYPNGKLSTQFRTKLNKNAPLKYKLKIVSNVKGRVFINGKYFGETELSANLEKKRHTIRIEKTGYEAFEQTIQLQNDQIFKGMLQPIILPTNSTWTETTLGIEFVFIPKGCFVMGSPVTEESRVTNERQHRVCVSKGFWMSKHEITNAQFKSMKASHNSGTFEKFSLDKSNQPVVNVKWDDAIVFAQWLSKKTGEKFRLPTEVEWEYAARSGNKGVNIWDKDKIKYHANFIKNDNFFVSAPVGKFAANKFGLYDILGNAFEWTCSSYSKPYIGAEERCVNLKNTASRVVRGGSWKSNISYLRPASRNPVSRYHFSNDIGFRLVKD
jgi:formylglycine-generating enzyme required for sulfatase activity